MKVTKYSVYAAMAVLGFGTLALLLLAGLLIYLMVLLYWMVNPKKIPVVSLPKLFKSASPAPAASSASVSAVTGPQESTIGDRWMKTIEQTLEDRHNKFSVNDIVTGNDESTNNRFSTHQLTWGPGNG